MKRTRRIEVVRYSRSTTISHEFAGGPDISPEQAAVDVLLELPRMIEPPIEEASRAPRQPTGVAVPRLIRISPFRTFFKWLSRGWRVW